jgi:hypothetical protein
MKKDPSTILHLVRVDFGRFFFYVVDSSFASSGYGGWGGYGNYGGGWTGYGAGTIYFLKYPSSSIRARSFEQKIILKKQVCKNIYAKIPGSFT